MEGFVAYCEKNEAANKPGTSMATLFYAIKKHHILNGGSESEWVNEQWLPTYVKGLKKGSGVRGKERLGLTIDMQRELVANARGDGWEELAVGYEILFRGLVRHDHLHRLRFDTIEHRQSFCKIWMTGFKGDGDAQEGQWVKIIGMNKEILEQVARAEMAHGNRDRRLLPTWEENLAVSFLQRTAHIMGWPRGFRYDVHCLRVGGAGEQEILGASVPDLRMKGVWASDAVHGYRGTLAPNQALVRLKASDAPKLRRGKRMRVTTKAVVEFARKNAAKMTVVKTGTSKVSAKRVKGKNGRMSNLLV